MLKRTHEDFLGLVRQRIAVGKYDELFSGGCCFHFALRAYQRGIGSIACIPSAYDPQKKGHVFVITPDGRAFDHKGYREVCAVKKEFCAWGDEPDFPMTEEELKQEINARPFPSDLAQEVNTIADDIITEKA